MVGGRLGVLDASECPPTFNVDAVLVQGLIAGGDTALRVSSEHSEDSREGGARDLQAAGFADSELWWEQQFEKRHSGPDIFKAVLETMTALRDGQPLNAHEARREAWMRQTVREAQKEGHS